MHNDHPTLPNLPPAASRGTPMWPDPEERARRALASDRYANSLLLGVSLGANVVLLLAVLGLLVLGRAGIFSPGGSSASSPPGGTTLRSALSSPTATPSPSQSTGRLRVTPNRVHLGCDGGQRRQFVVLENTGPGQVQWRADLTPSGNQAGITVSPNQGTLAAGASQAIRIENQTSSDSGQSGSNQQGTIQFDPQSADAGPAPSLTYSAMICSG